MSIAPSGECCMCYMATEKAVMTSMNIINDMITTIGLYPWTPGECTYIQKYNMCYILYG